MPMHNQPTELTAKYKTSCPRPSCDIPIIKGDKIRVWRDKWYHGNCSLKLERDWIKREQKKDRRLLRETAKIINSQPQIATQENLRRALKKEADDKMLEKIRRPSPVPGLTVDSKPAFTNVAGLAMKEIKNTKKHGPSPIEALIGELSVYRRKHTHLVTALTWYARRSKYECNVEHDKPAVLYDEGNKARAAIKELDTF